MQSLSIKTTDKAQDAANFLAGSVIRQLLLKKRVLLFVTGGSSIAVAVEVAGLISAHPHQNLAVTLTDERYGPLNHPDSNWRQLLEKGFSLPEAKLLPILTGEGMEAENKKFSDALEEEFRSADYKVGLFGIGKDGHVAGILPGSPAVLVAGWSAAYDAGKFERITITPETIVKLDEAVVFAEGEEKWPIIRDLAENDLDISQEPAQILKKVPLLTIFTDYKLKE